MKYQFTKEEVKVGDACVLVWDAPNFGVLKDDAPKGKKGETVIGENHESYEGMGCFIPVIVENITNEWVRLRLYREKEDGKFGVIYTQGQVEPLSLEINNTDEVFTRLIKNNWVEHVTISNRKTI